jgi:hypothetical protein
MQTLAGFLLLPAFFYGYAQASWLGGLTGFVAVLLMGSGLAITLAGCGKTRDLVDREASPC